MAIRQDNFLLMHKERLQLFDAPWMHKYNISPFPIEPDLMDLDSEFMQLLHDSLKSGWDKTQYLVIAVSTDPRLQGQPINGRHRIVVISRLLKEGFSLLNDILIKYEEVNNVDELRAKRAAYESRSSISKDPKVAKKWIKANLYDVVKNNYDKNQKKIIDYLHKVGFANDKVSIEVIEQYRSELDKKERRKSNSFRKNQKTISHPIPESFSKPWSERDQADVYSGKDERFDIKISYKECPDCKRPLKLTSDDQGNILKIESAPQIPE